MSATRVHPETGKVLRRDTRRKAIVVGSLSRTVDVPGWYPDDDSDAIHTGADLKKWDETFKVLRKEYADRVKSVRKALRLTQEEAGLIIGGGKRAFQKYESGQTPPSDAAVGLLEVLSKHPESLKTLRNVRMIAIKSKPKAAKVANAGRDLRTTKNKAPKRSGRAVSNSTRD